MTRCCLHQRRLWVMVGVALIGIHEWNRGFVVSQKEAPLDHLFTTLQKPLYRCLPIIPDSSKGYNTTIDVPFYMISARPRTQVQPILRTWQVSFPVELFATHNISSMYKNKMCLEHTFNARLFAVYLYVMKWIMRMHPSVSHFVIIEDDTVLLDGSRLRDELLWAIEQRLDYYSFHSTTNNTCLYEWGTQAQVFSRRMMRRILEVDKRSFCRLPIDMYIARLGPWYVTQRPLVKHVGKRIQNVVPQ